MGEYPGLDALAESLPDDLAVELRLALLDLVRLRGHVARLVEAGEAVVGRMPGRWVELEEAVSVAAGPRARAEGSGTVAA